MSDKQMRGVWVGLFIATMPLLMTGGSTWSVIWFVIVLSCIVSICSDKTDNKSDTPSQSNESKPAPKVSIKPSKSVSSYTKQQLRQIAFDYTDSEGVSSYREVAVNSVDDYYIKAFCLSRHATRTFRIDRVDGYITMRETGELLSVSDWLHLYR